MAKYYIGIDGGGSKTSYAVADENLEILASNDSESISYREHGIETIVERIQINIKELLDHCGIDEEEVVGICIGLPAYGENEAIDQELEYKLLKNLPYRKIFIVNDGIVGYYGALEGKSGINIVSGTGSIAYGEDEKGNQARCGGWSEQFGDEGSCYWIGKKAMELYCKEVDGRCESGPLQSVVNEDYHITNPIEFIEIMEKTILPSRKETASFQRIAAEATRQGDKEAQKLYELAAKELALLAKGVKKQLHFEKEPIHVSLTGGILNVKELILPYLEKELNNLGFVYQEHKEKPIVGALLYAKQHTERSK